MINHLISFDLPEFALKMAVANVSKKYINTTYTVTVRDCVSFTADVARAVGLMVPMVNMTPWGLIQILRMNPHTDLR